MLVLCQIGRPVLFALAVDGEAGVRKALQMLRDELEIAMALALQSKALLLDEPMAGMGPEGSKRLTGFLDTLRQEAPILLVEHDMDAVFALADRISVLVYGRIIATGTVEDIRRDPAVRTAYLGDHA